MNAVWIEKNIEQSMKCGDREIQIQGRLLRVARPDADLYRFVSDPEPILTYLRNNVERVDLFTFMQGITDPVPRFKYSMEWDNLAALPISTFEHWWKEQIGPKIRNAARRAERKGVEIREVPFSEELARGIWEIYNECPVRQGRHFRHYGTDLETVFKLESTYLECSTFIGAYLGDELIGFIKMVADERGMQAGLMNILGKIKHRDKSPTNALIAQAVKSCAERGVSYLVYGHYVYGSKEWDGLVNFKQHNGFLRVDLPRYYVPLTGWGQLALHLGLHHRAVDRMPEFIKRRFREARTRWYRKGQQTYEHAL